MAEGDRVVTHFFECKEPAYRGWRWAVTVARASRAKIVTLDETVLLPGPDALLAPEWVPWSERLRPGDLGPATCCPPRRRTSAWSPGYTGEEPAAGRTAPRARRRPARRSRLGGGPSSSNRRTRSRSPVPREGLAPSGRGSIAAVAEELGMRRARVLSRYGLHAAADRWEDAFGARTPMAQAAPASCVSCGFLVPLAGSLRQAFGVCANEFSPADGRVVSLSYGCGGHSEAAVMPKPPQPPPPVLDETQADELS